MTTELRCGDERRAPIDTAECIKGWRNIHALAVMEGRLMAIAAAKRVLGYCTKCETTQVAFIAFEFVRSGYSNRLAMNASCKEIAESVEQLALQIDECEWIWAVDYESGAWQIEHEHDDAPLTGIMTFEGVEYQLVPHRSNSVDACVYVQAEVSGNGRFEIVELSTGMQVAILPTVNIAKHIASYAVSIHGGYGDVLIKETPEKATHHSISSWFLN